MPDLAPALDLDDPRTRRIVEVALHLAEEGGFAAVRLRDVAQGAEVALRTLYKRFPGKDDLIFAVLAAEMLRLEGVLAGRPPRAATPVARLRELFGSITDVLCGRPNLGRAVVRALAAGSSDLSRQVSTFHLRIAALIIDAIHGRPEPLPDDPHHPHRRLGTMLQHVWFSALVGWSNGLHTAEEIVDQVIDAAALVLEPTPS